MINTTLELSLSLFLLVVLLVLLIKPSIFYNKEGDLKGFGLSDPNKSLLPLWLFLALCAVISYSIVIAIKF